MDDTELEFFVTHWNSVISKGQQQLEPDDRDRAAETRSWKDLQKRIWVHPDTGGSPTLPNEIALIKPTLGHCNHFVEFFEGKVGNNLDAAFLWGILRVLLELTPEDPWALGKIPQWLKKIGYKLEAFNSCCLGTDPTPNRLKEACFDMLVQIVEFIIASVKTLREDDGASLHGKLTNVPEHWLQLERLFTSTNQELNETLGRVEKLAFITSSGMIQNISGMSSNTRLPEQPARCFLLSPIKVSRFFNRVDLFEKLDQALGQTATGASFRSVTLYGLGGIGKSAIATRYVEKKIEENAYDAVFWVHGEKSTALRQSFTKIALRLKLPGADAQKDDENLVLVQNWFQTTDCRWLVIYDNVESSDLLMPYWPGASHGKAIITTRNHSLANEPASTGIEVFSWDPQRGSEFLLFLLKQDVGKDIESEGTSAYELAKRLNGHALGISHMAGLIHRRSWSITEFMSIYLKNPRKAHTSELEAIWDFSFKRLQTENPDSLKVLNVVAFLMPDDIPQTLFEFNDEASIPTDYGFCSDDYEFSEAIEPLITLSLMKRNRDSRTFSVHRMVQTQYKYFLSQQDRQKAFDDTVSLVHLAFPRMDNTKGQLYDKWAQCNLYLQHLIGLADYFKEELRISKAFKATWKFCELLNQGQRFLYESNVIEDLQKLCDINAAAVNTIESGDRHDDLKASILSHQANLYESIGMVDKAIEWNKEAYEIRLHETNPKFHLIAGFESNLGYCYDTANDHETALMYFRKAQTTCLSQKLDWPTHMKKNMARCMFHGNNLNEARSLLLASIAEFKGESPLNWAMIAYAHFTLGLLERRGMNLDSAEACFIEAQNVWFKGDQTRLHPFNGACMYKTGVVCLDQGKVEAAIKHLRDSLEVTDHHKKFMPVEHARSLFKLSEALSQEQFGDDSEAEELRDDAEIFLKRRNADATDFGSEDQYDKFVPIFWR